MALTKDSTKKDAEPTFNTSPDHPDEVVQPVAEVPSEAIAAAKLRHEQAESEFATPQEKKQAAVEQAHALSTRPDGSYAQLHETDAPTLAVADDSRVSEMKKDQEEAIASLKGETEQVPAAAYTKSADADRASAAAKSASDRPTK
ncbi:MAG TPA: hypothetical protein VGJ95_06850 [Pseudonocardiaceae bacterium]|jgi:hypothetical protein